MGDDIVTHAIRTGMRLTKERMEAGFASLEASGKRCYIFDVDGTLVDCSHRRHYVEKSPKDWDAFYAACSDDPPIPHMVDVCWSLIRSSIVVFVTGRPERLRVATLAWLALRNLYGNLYMRADGDYRADDIVKLEILAQLRADGFEPALAFDDRDRVVKMWRAAGIPCAQVAEGSF